MCVFLFLFCFVLFFCISGHVQIQGWESPFQKLRDERVKRDKNILRISSDRNCLPAFSKTEGCS